jgi:hypothetical protein
VEEVLHKVVAILPSIITLQTVAEPTEQMVDVVVVEITKVVVAQWVVQIKPIIQMHFILVGLLEAVSMVEVQVPPVEVAVQEVWVELHQARVEVLEVLDMFVVLLVVQPTTLVVVVVELIQVTVRLPQVALVEVVEEVETIAQEAMVPMV